MLSREVEAVLAVFALVVMGLVQLARRRPDIAWLRPFRSQLTPQQQERQRRRADRYAGMQLILLGLVIPIGYVALTVMMFNDFDPLWTTGVIIASLGCIALGITALVRSR